MARGDIMVELDFFRIEKENAARFRAMDQRSSNRRIQSVISRINPQLLRSVLASGAAWPVSTPPPSPMPALNPSLGSVGEISTGTAPLTIFYNGTVAVFDLPLDKAEVILKLAEEGYAGDGGREGLPEELNGDLLPMARKKSLQRFLGKRKARLTVAEPYGKDIN